MFAVAVFVGALFEILYFTE